MIDGTNDVMHFVNLMIIENGKLIDRFPRELRERYHNDTKATEWERLIACMGAVAALGEVVKFYKGMNNN